MTGKKRTRPAATSPLARQALQPHVEPLIVEPSSTDSGTPAVPDPRATALPDSQTPAVPDSRDTGLPDSRPPAAVQGADEPRWKTLVRKESRIRADQADDLAQLRRRLSQARVKHVETITDNTLIRVAVDLLLTRADELAGDTEDELRGSVIP